MDDMSVTCNLAGFDDRIQACETESRVTFHAPESIGGSGQEGHGCRDMGR
jgi:hypothetical protein